MPDVRVDTSVRVPRGVDDLRPSRAAAVPSTRSHRLLFIGYDNGGDPHLLRLRGLLDLRTAGLLAAALGELERASAFDVVLDLDAVTSCDGTALAVILGGARRLERARPPAADRGRERCRLCRDGEDPGRKAPLSRPAGPPGAGRLSPIAPRRTRRLGDPAGLVSGVDVLAEFTKPRADYRSGPSSRARSGDSVPSPSLPD